MEQVRIWSIPKEEGHDKLFRNISHTKEQRDQCPICLKKFGGYKVVCGRYKKDDHEFRVCVHKKCLVNVTLQICFDVLERDKKYGKIVLSDQFKIAKYIHFKLTTIY